MKQDLILLTGATGYIGGRLLVALAAQGRRLRCLARRPAHVRPPRGADVEVVAGDLHEPVTLTAAFAGVHTAYYLVHSLGEGPEFETKERAAAAAFGTAAQAAGVRRIIYLGGLGRGPALSPHLASRQDVGRVLAASGVPVTELRAAIVIGSGSLSFEMIRALVEKLPAMVVPRWASVLTQPIAVEDAVAYLVAALDQPGDATRIYEIGGADQVSYLELMREYARQRGLRRRMATVPVLTPRLSSLWLGLVTPVQARVGRQLILSLGNETVVTDPSAAQDFAIRPRSLEAAIARALVHEDRAFALTRWSDALSSHPPADGWAGAKFGPRFVDSRALRTSATPAAAFTTVSGIGGRRGWYFGDWLWTLRGALDRLAGGPGLRRGRRDPDAMRPGDAVDFWRVEAVEAPTLLRLRAEMRVPGRAWLQFEVSPADGRAEIRQTAIFDAVGLGGLLYWYTLYPIHAVVFRGMLRGLARAAVAQDKPRPG